MRPNEMIMGHGTEELNLGPTIDSALRHFRQTYAYLHDAGQNIKKLSSQLTWGTEGRYSTSQKAAVRCRQQCHAWVFCCCCCREADWASAEIARENSVGLLCTFWSTSV